MIHILLGIFHPTGLDGLDSDIKEIPARIRGINYFQIRIELIFGTQILVVPDSLDCNQWPFQEPKKLEVPTIYKAYASEYPDKIWPYMVQSLHFRIGMMLSI